MRCAFTGKIPAMDRLEEARRAWQDAQAELQRAAADLTRFVSDVADPAAVKIAFEVVARKRAYADDCLQRYITQLGKS